MSDDLKIVGKIFTGFGEGRFFVKLPGYFEQFESILDLKPFYGTLNIRVKPEEAKRFLTGIKYVEISGFSEKNRDFGKIYCYKVLINDMLCYVVVPEINRYGGDTLEIISEYNLREKLDLSDGDEVVIKY